MRALLMLVASCQAFYLPGVFPRDYGLGEQVELKVNHLSSTKTQLPMDYYSLAFCAPPTIIEASENLGEVMSGDLIENSPYDILMRKTVSCQELCTKRLSVKQLQLFESHIRDDYTVNWIVDNIPAATVYRVNNGEKEFLTAEKGFQLGQVVTSSREDYVYLNNHVRLILSYHQESAEGGYRIVGFEVVPFSVNHRKGRTGELTTCDALHPIEDSSNPLLVSGAGEEKEVIFTYDVMWVESDVAWASRWDIYLSSIDSEVHWFSITNSLIVALLLSGVLATILIRALKADLTRYNSLADMTEDELEEREEEIGWKQVHGDVFRTPAHAGWLSVFVGTGVQLFFMTLATLAFACAGLLSPANRGGLMTAFLVLFVFMGCPAGYCGARLARMFGLRGWKRHGIKIATFFPGVVFCVFFLLNLLVWSQASTSAIPFTTMIALIALWVGVSATLTIVGAYFGTKLPPIEHPTRVKQIARMIPSDQKWLTNGAVPVLMGGCLPFGAVYMETVFLMSSVWQHQFYYLFGILTIVFVILCVTCAEISIFVVYYQLAAENYHWWWKSFMVSASSGLYLFGYSVYYFFTELQIVKFVSGALFFGYMAIVAFAFALLTGTIGFLATFLFVRKIYATVKID